MPDERPRHLALVAAPGSEVLNEDHASGSPAESLGLFHPELARVLRRAMSMVVDALELGEQTSVEVLGELEDAAARAMADGYEPVAAAAGRLAAATAASRAAEAASVSRRAGETAALVAETAAVLRRRQERLAAEVAAGAAADVRAAAASSVPGFKFEAKNRAIHWAQVVRDAAAERAGQRAAGASLVAAAADSAAAGLVGETARAAATVERNADRAAATVQATALEVLYEIAIDAACRRYAVISPPEVHSPSAPQRRCDALPQPGDQTR